jgi:hypothetical protein
VINRGARFIKPIEHMKLNNNYYTHYFNITYYFECLTRIEQLETLTYALQDNMPRIYERYHAIASRRKLSLLAHGPNPCHFLLYSLHYVKIISDYTYYFKNPKMRFWCVFIAESLPIGTTTTGGQ